ncbi:efflux transporter outer membrane subunit [Paraburkholderia silvatlantica]|uniref:NodT family efflux transporter outer membrane factor (OMF) lipoprotein n=1 Tax=Paraburkholderia silvatlantica TaxID=321895 RepID=A0ABR6FW52_9BURK|nr:efflux transporter outer membrane subunit [Paraburkholderia silvatlantica]MBB2931660.1 NodT family efflux transporter outer membrane factor (OMF) lipoprotein [Paraburkholderia silvatlantica]PVY26550.1 NodT family efflux transporter outer membrane factor (OMF) lipoprotein [Paraburkholderia silvatlantica]PXW32815.1 NodT family efflux transporter outer membrane factor (OMF) lipoprotein [Paraburkholderia silvatlantica]
MAKPFVPAHPLRAAALAAALLLSACSFAPAYRAPVTAIPTHFKEAGGWQTARPADQLPRDGWWRAFDDPVLNQLEPQVAKANPNVAAALARHDEADALVAQARSALLPSVGAEANVSRERQSALRPLRGSDQPNVYNSNTLDVGIGYDIDLWGKVRNEVKADEASSVASEADIASLQLSLQARLATTWFDLLGLDQQSKLLDETIAAYRHALDLTESRHRGGIASSLDVSRAKTQLASAQAAADDVSARRALYEHAIATLIGVPASQFNVAPDTIRPHLPNLPAGLPSALLQRRPDIAAAERRVAAANARIGVAKAAFFPDLSLGLDGGFQSDTFSPWIVAPNEMWSIGPTLMMTIFDGGRRAAVVRGARALLAENGAQYKATVLGAFQQVEDNLALLHHLGDEAQREDEALTAAQRTLTLSMSRYRDGVVSYLDVVTAQTTELSTQIASLELDTRRLDATVGLIQAIGGGWSLAPINISS